MKINLRIFFIISCALFCLTACKDFKEVECTGVQGFKINKVDAKSLNADILLSLKNPNSFGFSIYPSDFEVAYNGIHLGKARLSKRVHISANAEETYSFNLKSDLKNLNLMDVMQLISGATGKANLEVKGELKAGKFYLKKKFPVNVKERLGTK